MSEQTTREIGRIQCEIKDDLFKVQWQLGSASSQEHGDYKPSVQLLCDRVAQLKAERDELREALVGIQTKARHTATATSLSFHAICKVFNEINRIAAAALSEQEEL